MQKYNILLSSDNNYLPYAFVTCQSIINSIDPNNTDLSVSYTNACNNRETIVFTLAIDKTVDSNSLQEKCDKFINRNSKYIDIEFRLKIIDSSLFLNGRQLNNSYSTYYRILIDKLFDESVSQVLYLDCDLLVRKDIRTLFLCTNMSNSVIAGVLDTAIDYLYDGETKVRFSPKHSKDKCIEVDLNNYINAGVILFNLTAYRKLNISQKCFNLLNSHNFNFHDQDLLNVSIKDKVFLDLTWNFTTAYYFNSYNPFTSTYSTPPRKVDLFLQTSSNYHYSNEDFIKVSKDPAICHFTSLKPWRPINSTFTNLPFNNEIEARLKEWYATASRVIEFSEQLSQFNYSEIFSYNFTTCLLNSKITENQTSIYKHNSRRKRDRKIILALISMLFIMQIIVILLLLFK